MDAVAPLEVAEVGNLHAVGVGKTLTQENTRTTTADEAPSLGIGLSKRLLQKRDYTTMVTTLVGHDPYNFALAPDGDRS